MVAIVVMLLVSLILLRGLWRNVPGIGESLERFADWLSGFDVVLGVIAIVVGVLELISLEGLLLILAGLILAVSAMRTIPSIGPSLGRLGDSLSEFRAVLGVIMVLVALLGLVNFLLH